VNTLRTLGLQLRTARHVLRRHPLSARALAEPLDQRMVFVVGCPRSGTTFLARSIGSCPGFVDLGEVAAYKAAIPDLVARDPASAQARIRRLLTVSRRLGLVGGLRSVEQTPEGAFVAPAVSLAFPEARILHIVRDGRDVVSSLLERGWLSAGRRGSDDAGQAYGPYARFWVEPERRKEFEGASDARRAAWAWRRYVQAARSGPTAELRYERLAAEPDAVALELAELLETDPGPLVAALAAVHDASVGRHARDLTSAQLADVEAEAGSLLAELGYGS
jgi:Sulfotransferase family